MTDLRNDRIVHKVWVDELGRALARNAFASAALAIYSVALTFPLFLSLNGSIHQERSVEKAEVLPLGIFVAIGVLVPAGLALANQLRAALRAALPATIVCFGTLLFHLAMTLGQPFAPEVWVIYNVPMMLGVLGGVLMAQCYSLRTALRLFAWPVALVASVHLFWSVSTLGPIGAIEARGAWDFLNLFAIYQKTLSYAFIVMLANVFLIFFEKGWFRWIFVALLVLESFMLASREPFAFLAGFVLLYLVARRRWRDAAIVVSIGVLGAVAATQYADIIQDAPLVARTEMEVNSGDRDLLTGGRESEVRAQLDDALDGLALGSGFEMTEKFRSSPHNQYVEYVLRGGLGLLFAMTFLLGRTIRQSLTLAREASDFLFIAIALAAAMLTSFNINVPMRVPFYSMTLWTLVGVVWAKCHGRALATSPKQAVATAVTQPVK